MYIYIFFFSNNKAYYIVHCTYLLSHSLSILDLISVKIKVYRHLSPPSLTHSLLEAEPHTHTHRVRPPRCCHWQLLAGNMKQHHHIATFIQCSAGTGAPGRTVEPTWLPLKSAKTNSYVWLCLEFRVEHIQKKKKKKTFSSWVKTSEQRR